MNLHDTLTYAPIYYYVTVRVIWKIQVDYKQWWATVTFKVTPLPLPLLKKKRALLKKKKKKPQ